MGFQHSHHSTPFEKKGHEIIVLCDGVTGPANIGGLFRICDAFGISKLIFFNSEIDLTSTRLRRTARATETKVPHLISENIHETLKQLQSEGYQSIGLEITSNSLPINKMKISEPNKIVLVIGNERTGISNDLIKTLDALVHIEMFGENSSMNVTQATGIALYELTRKSI